MGTPVVANFYNETELRVLIPILGTNLLIVATGRQHRTMMLKQFNFKAIAIIELVSYFLGLIAAVLLAINDFGVYSLVYSTLLSSFIANVLFLGVNLKLNPIRFHFQVQETKPFLKIGGFTMGSSLLDFFSRETDMLIIGKMLGAESLGVYTLSKQIVMKLYAIVNPTVINVLNPILSSMQKEKHKLKGYYLRVVNLLASINFPIYLLITILSKEILFILYGADYITGYLVLSFLAISYGTNTIGNPVGSLQIATGRTDIGFKWTIIRVMITPVIIYMAATWNINTVSAAIAFLSFAMLIPMWFIQLKPMAEITLTEYLHQFAKPYLLMLLFTGAFLTCSQYYELPFSMILNAIIKGSVTITFFFAALWLGDKNSLLQPYKLIVSLTNK